MSIVGVFNSVDIFISQLFDGNIIYFSKNKCRCKFDHPSVMNLVEVFKAPPVAGPPFPLAKPAVSLRSDYW